MYIKILIKSEGVIWLIMNFINIILDYFELKKSSADIPES